MDTSRFLALAGIHESTPEEGDATVQREQQIEGAVRDVFGKLGLEIDTKLSAVVYFERTQDVSVTLYENPQGYPLHALAALQESGLGTDYRIEADGDRCVVVTFKVNAQ